MWNRAQQEKFNFYFSKVFFLVLTKLPFWQGDWVLGYHSMNFRQFPDFPVKRKFGKTSKSLKLLSNWL